MTGHNNIPRFDWKQAIQDSDEGEVGLTSTGYLGLERKVSAAPPKVEKQAKLDLQEKFSLVNDENSILQTENSRLRAKLKAAETKASYFQKFFNSASEPSLFVTADFLIVKQVNKAAEKMLNADSSSLVGNSLKNLMKKNRSDLSQLMVRALAQGKATMPISLSLGGKVAPAVMHANAVRSDQEILGVFVSIQQVG
jgi:transcriptional regulator with PAS, ATPase and Fis domain